MATAPGKSLSAPCPECEKQVQFASQPAIGATVECPNCGTMLEVIETNPLELDWAYDDSDDKWDDEDWDNEEFKDEYDDDEDY